MKRTILFLTILLAACSPFVPQTPQEPPMPTAFIDPSYPTMESAPLTVMKQPNSIDVSADRAWRDGKQVNVDVCYTLLDNSTGPSRAQVCNMQGRPFLTLAPPC
jgi:hypothetical protein